jgi:hypothetical protein
MSEPLDMFVDLDDSQPLPPTTPELRAAVRLRARQIHRKRVVAFAVPASLVAAGVVALLVIVGLPANRASVQPATPTPTATKSTTEATTSPSPTTTAVDVGLPYGKTGTRAQVPWDQVGTGWFLVTVIEKAKGELYLTDPQGGRYAITSLPLGAGGRFLVSHLADWSPDGREALLVGSVSAGRTQITWVDLRTGASHGQNVPYNLMDAQFSRPTGTRVLLDLGSFGTPGARLYRLAWQQTPALLTTVEGDGPLYAPDGTYMVLSAASGLTVIRNNGTLLRHLAVPGRCSPVKWWTGSELLASCALGNDPNRLWLVPAGGGQATALTPTRPTTGPDLGDVDAWQLTSGLFTHALGPCGSQFLMRQGADGQATVVTVPGLGNNVLAETGQGSRIAVLGLLECGRGSALVWLEPATGRTETIATGDIGSVLPWDATEQ